MCTVVRSVEVKFQGGPLDGAFTSMKGVIPDHICGSLTTERNSERAWAIYERDGIVNKNEMLLIVIALMEGRDNSLTGSWVTFSYKRSIAKDEVVKLSEKLVRPKP